MEEILQEMKTVFENGNEAAKSPDCKRISVLDLFAVNETEFYMVRYEGAFKRGDGKTLAYLYACFADNETEAPVAETEFEAEIDAICRMKSLTATNGRYHCAR
jgi:hypothetical protein